MTQQRLKINQPIQRVYFSQAEIAEKLGVTGTTLRDWERDFRIPVDRLHGKRKYTVNVIGQFAIVARLLRHLHFPAALIQYNRGRAEDVLAVLEPNVPVTVQEDLQYGAPMFLASVQESLTKKAI